MHCSCFDKIILNRTIIYGEPRLVLGQRKIKMCAQNGVNLVGIYLHITKGESVGNGPAVEESASE